MTRFRSFKLSFLFAATLAPASIGTSVAHADDKPTDAPKVNYTDHVLPVFRQHCLKCHNANEAKGGLAIDSYAKLMEGGGSGEVVFDGDAAGSRLYQLMIHADTPVMPPNQDPIPKEQLQIIEQWINGGLLENSGSKAKKRKGPSLSFTSMDASGKPSEIVMPESCWRVPVTVSNRAGAATAIASSPWAPLVAVGGQRQVSLYNTDTLQLEGIIPFPEGLPHSIRFSQDGAYLMVAGGQHSSMGMAAVYSLKTGQRLFRVGDELDTVFGADVNNQLNRVALGGPQKMLRIFDTATGQSVFEIKKHTDWIYCVDYSPDGILIASGDRAGGLHVWEADTGRLYLDLVGHKGAIRGLAWRADSNLLASASEDGTVMLWEMVEGKNLKSFSAHGGGATGIAMAADGRIATCGKDKTVKVWKADGAAIATMPAFAEPALEVAFTHDGTKVIGGDWAGRTVIWNIADPKQSSEVASNPPTLEQQQQLCAAKIAEHQKALAAAEAAVQAAQKNADAGKAGYDGMVAKLQQTKDAIAKAQADSASAEALLAQLKSQVDMQNKLAGEINGKVTAADKKLNELKANLAASNKAVQEASARRDAARKVKTEATAAMQKANAELKSANEQVASVGAKIDELKKQAGEDQAKIKASEPEVAKLNQEIAAAKKRVEELTKAVAGEQAKINQASQDDTKNEQARVAGAAKVAEINKAIAQSNTELAAAKKEKVAADAKLAELKKQFAAQPGVIAKFKKDIDDKTKSIPNLEKAVTDSKANWDKLNAAVAQATTQAASAKQTLDSAGTYLEELKTEFVAFKDAKAQLAQSLAAATALAAEKAKAVEAETKEVDQMVAVVQKQEAEAKKLQDQINAINAQLEKVRAVQQEQQKALTAAQAEAAKVEAAAEEAAADAQAKQAAIEFFETAYGS